MDEHDDSEQPMRRAASSPDDGPPTAGRSGPQLYSMRLLTGHFRKFGIAVPSAC